jgi:hypothetical protein
VGYDVVWRTANLAGRCAEGIEEAGSHLGSHRSGVGSSVVAGALTDFLGRSELRRGRVARLADKLEALLDQTVDTVADVDAQAGAAAGQLAGGGGGL